MGPRPPVVERRSLPRPGYAIRADDRAEMGAVIALMRDVPREALATTMDLLHHNRRLAGRLLAVLGRLEVVEAVKVARTPRTRLLDHPRPDARAVAEAVFKRPAMVRREKLRTIPGRKGRRVEVVERVSRQLALPL